MAKLLGLAVLILPFVVLFPTGCDVNPSPTSATTVNSAPQSSTRLNGTFASASSSRGLRAFSQTALDDITVEVQNTDIRTRVRSDGTFTLVGLPEGSFTLVFRNENGDILGELTFTDVVDGQTISLLLKLAGGTVTLEEERRDGVVVNGTIQGDDESPDDTSEDDTSEDDTSKDDDSKDDENTDDKSGDDDNTSSG